MREIKFRAWSKQDNKMFPSVGVDDGGIAIIDTMAHQLYQLKGESMLMQYTGLKDKNGKEIYEGDIFSIPPDYHHKYEERNVVEYGDGVYLLEEHGLHLNDWNDRGEVIGNIYENPELFERRI